jgi:hypothetical protein
MPAKLATEIKRPAANLAAKRTQSTEAKTAAIAKKEAPAKEFKMKTKPVDVENVTIDSAKKQGSKTPTKKNVVNLVTPKSSPKKDEKVIDEKSLLPKIMPKRPMTGFIFFTIVVRMRLKEEGSTLSMVEMTKQSG